MSACLVVSINRVALLFVTLHIVGKSILDVFLHNVNFIVILCAVIHDVYFYLFFLCVVNHMSIFLYPILLHNDYFLVSILIMFLLLEVVGRA